jgi:hypothetical protein
MSERHVRHNTKTKIKHMIQKIQFTKDFVIKKVVLFFFIQNQKSLASPQIPSLPCPTGLTRIAAREVT